jgi:hypothetical protein
MTDMNMVVDGHATHIESNLTRVHWGKVLDLFAEGVIEPKRCRARHLTSPENLDLAFKVVAV